MQGANVAASDLVKDLSTHNAGRYALGKIAELLARNNIDPDEVGEIKRVSVYQSLTKNDAGEAEIHDLFGIQISPKFESGPEWPVVQQGPVVKIGRAHV